MTPLTRRDVLAHQAFVPWPSQLQVEQDLLLCRAMAALFSDKFLCSQIAMMHGEIREAQRLDAARWPASRSFQILKAEAGIPART